MGKQKENVRSDGLAQPGSPDAGLATNGANPVKPGTAGPGQQYAELLAKLQACAAEVAQLGDAYAAGLDKLIPMLAEMKALLSKFGAKRPRGVQVGNTKWTPWVEQFLRENRIDRSLRSVQRRISAYEAAVADPHPLAPGQGPDQATRQHRAKLFLLAERRQRAKAGEEERQVASELFKACLHGGELDKELISRCRRLHIADEQDLTAGLEAARAFGSTPTPPQQEREGSSNKLPVGPSGERLPSGTCKAGRGDVLLDALNVEMGQNIRATFNVPLEEKVKLVPSFCESFIHTFAGLESFGVEVKLTPPAEGY